MEHYRPAKLHSHLLGIHFIPHARTLTQPFVTCTNWHVLTDSSLQDINFSFSAVGHLDLTQVICAHRAALCRFEFSHNGEVIEEVFRVTLGCNKRDTKQLFEHFTTTTSFMFLNLSGAKLISTRWVSQLWENMKNILFLRSAVVFWWSACLMGTAFFGPWRLSTLWNMF